MHQAKVTAHSPDSIRLRISGDFTWPPVEPGSDDEPTLTARGVVEVWYRTSDNEARAYVCWIPPKATPVPPQDRVPDLKTLAPHTAFAFWVDKLRRAKGAFELRGGQLFEDFAVPNPVNAVPLRADTVGANRKVSRLRFDRQTRGKPLIAELALPRFGEPTIGDATALIAKIAIPDRADDAHANAKKLEGKPSRGRVTHFAYDQLQRAVAAIGVNQRQWPMPRQMRQMSHSAILDGSSIVYRWSNVPPKFFPVVDDKKPGMVFCDPGVTGKRSILAHAIIAHTSERSLWIATKGGAYMVIEARVTWRNDDVAILRLPTVREPRLAPDIHVSIIANGSDSALQSPKVGSPCLSLWDLLNQSINDAGSGFDGLKAMSGGQPQTFLPAIVLDQMPSLSMMEAHAATPCPASQTPGGWIDVGPVPVDHAMRFTIGNSARGPTASIKWPGFDAPPQSSGKVRLQFLDPVDDPRRESGEWVAGFELAVDEPIPPAAGRMGSLRLSRAQIAPAPKSKVVGRIVIRTPRTRPLAELVEGKYEFRPQTEFQFSFPLASVEPVGTDVPWGDREIEETPLLVPLLGAQKAHDSSPKSPFQLNVVETIGPDTDRQLTAKIYEQSTQASEGTAEDRYALIATEPFGIIRFTRLPLDVSGDAENAIVAAFDSDTRTWLFKKMSDEYRYDFPPQGIGEGSDKPGRFEIYDLSSNGPGKGDIVPLDGDGTGIAVVRPWPDSDRLRSYIVPCRFSPSTTLWIRPSDLERNYFLPEWGAHELFRQRNDFGIGVGLAALRGEFLYGLAFGLSTRKESGPARMARVAELEALTGRLPAKSYTANPDAILQQRWSALRRALKTRHERLEIWTPSPTEPRPFGTARFEDGVTWALRRKTAALRPPVADAAQSETQDDPSGLPGGALWPLESRAFHDAIRSNPNANGGTIERIALSPTGGDANLRAEFLGGTLAIVAEVRGGFVQRQRVEIIGRIGVLWHRAKHVVVYERTVNPSAQFAPERDDEGWSRYRSRRPIVRKVSEFIELIEPVRKYPDLGSTDAGSCGFLDSVRFNSKTINVDSTWAVDVMENGTVRGYALPLWNRGAARRRPQVYPEPDIAFVTIGEGKEDRPLCCQGCLDTDNLWFYSEPTSGANPDAWNDVLGVDWGHVLPPSVIDQDMTPGGDSHGPDKARKTPVPRTMPGYRRFTWRLARADIKTAVNAAYGGKPVYVGLESVTFSRRMPAKPAMAPDTLKSFQTQSRWFASATTLIEKVEAAAKLNDAHAVKNAAVAFPGVNYWTDLNNDLKKLTNTFGCEDCTNECTQLQKRLATLIAAKGRLVAQSARELVEDQLKALEAQATADTFFSYWKEVDGDLRTRLEITLFTKTVADKQLLPLRSQLDTLIGGGDAADIALGNEIEKAKALLHGVLRQSHVALEELRERIDAVASSFTSVAVWSGQRGTTLITQVNEYLAALPARLRAEVDEAKHRFAAELGPLAVPAINKAGDLFASIERTIDEVAALLSELNGDVANSAGDCLTAIRNRHEAIVGAIAKLHEASKGIDDHVTQVLNGDGVPLKGVFSVVDGALRASAVDILSRQVIAKAIVDRIPEEVIQAIASAADTQSSPKDKLENAAYAGKAKLDEIVSVITDAVATTAVGGLTDIASEAKKICEKAQDWWRRNGPSLDATLPNADEWNAVVTSVNQLRDGADVKKWLEDNRTRVEKIVTISAGAWHTYSGVVSEKLMSLADGGVAAAPGNALRLLSAATTAPEIGVLKANADRIRCSYEDGRVKATKARASLNRLGDALKAMGIDVPFDGVGDTLTLPQEELEKLDLTRLFPNFGGLDLSALLGEVKVPKGLKDAVRITHDFDRQQMRAWVQVDVAVPVPGQKELFGIGPFVMYLRDSKLSGKMRAETSQEDDSVRDSGLGEILTNIDVVVGGERLLALEQARISYSGHGGLKFDFDPTRIRLHSAMQFVQDTFGQLFADDVGGMTVIKEQGLPVGAEHLFSLPTVSLMSGTTGIANIQLGNAFRLRAYPEFVIANRFNLSRADAPFLFTFFILGGTGYTFVDTSYSPLSNSLAVTVEAAAGGAAAFGFAWGPVNGVVAITFSLALTYRKVIRGGGQGEGAGLAVSVILVIIGNVSLYGMVDVYLGLMLRIEYREGGRIDGLGTLSVKVKVSRWVTLKYATQVTYTLRDGRTTTMATSSSGTELDQDKQKKLEAIKGNMKAMQGARG